MFNLKFAEAGADDVTRDPVSSPRPSSPSKWPLMVAGPQPPALEVAPGHVSVRLSISAASSDPSTTSRSQEVISPELFHDQRSVYRLLASLAPSGLLRCGRGAKLKHRVTRAAGERTVLPAADRGAGAGLGADDALIDGKARATGGLVMRRCWRRWGWARRPMARRWAGVASLGSPAGAACGAAVPLALPVGRVPAIVIFWSLKLGRGTSEIQNTANRSSRSRKNMRPFTANALNPSFIHRLAG